MTFLLEAAARPSIPLAAGLLACLLLRRAPAALRHAVLAAAVLAAATVMPLSAVLPSWGVPLSAGTAMPVLAPEAAAPSREAFPGPATVASSAAPVGMADLLLFTWIAGVALTGGLLLIGCARLARLTAGAQAVAGGPWPRLTAEIAALYGIRRPIVLLTVRAPDVLATWGLFKPRVLLPPQAHAWSEDRAYAVLCHELAHIRRYDWPVQLAAELLRSLFWFNPLLWSACGRLRRESEHACDDTVLGAGVGAATYASHLVDIAKACRPPAPGWLPALSVAHPSTLERRITAMLNIRVNRQPLTRRAFAVVLIALVGTLLTAASFNLSAQAAGPRALSGHVYDAGGAVLPGAEVTLTNEQQVKWSAVTDAVGTFEFTPVGTGHYVLEVVLPGFRSLQSELDLATADDWNRTITMQVGELQETVIVTGKRPAQRTAVAPAVTSGPVRVGGNIKAPRKLVDVHPVYPRAMQDAGLEGVVPMDALIDVDGTVASVRVLSAQVHPELARAAEQAVRQWVFSPTLLNGTPVQVQMQVSVRFGLAD